MGIEDSYCQAAYMLEKEINQNIGPEYPSSKFMILLEEMEKDGKRQEKLSKKAEQKSLGR